MTTNYISTDYECPYCENDYDYLGQHWRWNPQHRPKITQRQHEIVTGLLMGDGSIGGSDRKNQYIQCGNTNLDFLKWVGNEMGILSSSIRFHSSGEENGMKNIESGFSPNAEPNEYKDVYIWLSRSHPGFNKYDEWYGDDRRKRFPEGLELTPLILKIWFCCDGWIDSRRERNELNIACTNESDRKTYLRDLFKRKGFEARFIEEKYRSGKYEGRDKLKIRFTQSQSEELWNWMGGALPGFEYKWWNE